MRMSVPLAARIALGATQGGTDHLAWGLPDREGVRQ